MNARSRPLSAAEMTLDPVSMADSDSEEKTFDLVQRLKRVENWIDQVSRSREGLSHSGAIGILPMRKERKDRQGRRSRSRSSESESETNISDMITKKKHIQPLRGRRTRSQTKKLRVAKVSDNDSEETEERDDDERSDDFLVIFPDEWLTPRRQAGKLKRFIDFCKAGSIRINDDILNTFIPKTEKSFFTRHTDASWNALAVKGVTAEGRKDSPEAVRVMELLQPALESGFEAAKAIAALTTRELRKAHLGEEEKERLRGLFSSYALIADCISRINLLKVIPQSNWENVKCFLEGGTSKDVPESLRRFVESTSFFRPEGDGPGYGVSPASPTAFSLVAARSGSPRRYSTGRNLRASLTDSSKSMASRGASRISGKERDQHRPYHSMHQLHLGEWLRSQFPSPQLLRGYKEDQQQVQLLDRANGPKRSEGKGGRALLRDSERRKSRPLQLDGDGQNAIELRGSDNATGSPIQSTDSYKNGTRGNENSEREHGRRLRRSPQDKTEERAEIREGGREGSLESFWDCYRVPNWEHPGGELEDSYCGYSRRRREYTNAAWPQDARSEEENSEWTTEGATSWETGEQTERVEEDWGRQTSEPLYKSSMKKSPIPNLTRGKKTQTRISGNNGDDEQLFSPLGGGVKGRSGEAGAGVGGEVVQPHIHGKAFQDGFPGDSCGTPGGERLDDNSGHIEGIPACQSGREIQSLFVLQLSKSMLCLRRDAIWGKGRAQGFHEDYEKGGVIYQRKVESEASNLPGRHSPHAPKQGCIEIDLTGDSPVPEKSGLDTVGREANVGTRKERGVSGMVVELREDGSNDPRKEESAAPGGCANLDSICKEKEETKDEGFCSTPREVEFCEVTTPTSELVDEAHATHAEAGNSPRMLERNRDSQPNDSGRINTLEENPAGEQTEMSEEENKDSSTYNGCVRAGMGCSVNNTEGEQRGEDICPWELDPPGECVRDKRKGVQSSVEDTGEKGSIAATTEDRPYSSEDRQHVHEMDNSEEEGSAIAHSNTESIGEETEQPGHYDTNGTSPGRAEHGSRCTQPDGEKAGLCTEGGESLRDIANSRTENTGYNIRTDCACVLWNLEGADLDPATAAWAFDKDPGDLSGVHDSGSEDEKGRMETTPRRGNKRYTGEENIPGRDLFLTWGEYVGARDIAAAILRNQKSERDTWRSLRRFKQFLDRESMDDTYPLTTRDAIWIIGEETKIDRKDIEIFLKTYVGDKPRKSKRYRTTWDLTIITKWAEVTYERTDTQTIQRRALILTMIFGALRPAELERMRSDTTLFKDELVQTKVQTKTSGGETVNVIINKHPNPRIDPVAVLQRWMDYTKMTFKDEHVWFNISERQPANLQRIKEELVAVLRENGIPDTFTAYSIRHAVITHLAKQHDVDWKAINAYARCAPGSRVTQEYYTVLPVQDTRWILETIGGPVPLAEKGDKSEKDNVRKDIINENTESETKEYPEETPQLGGEVERGKRKRAKRLVPIRERRSQQENDITQPPKGDETPPIIPCSIMELTKGRQTASQKKLVSVRRKRGERSIGQIASSSQVSKT
ncbi:uncharacterized protein MONOS_13084 [Monocercomonoides exilis]|uniref:uncharacterized protein n=1 Tax=Monocercomonoides exilis TaxID=2049356 RepID=UPI00355A8CC3|nr:hypothetical protein MONOS_13084 [Monocercomonoides exilis]|eukprot:MONOS_13084.1-p1 / transcript=MONOS_13084.1 / gene=MONOS_13084 / organism=Monocercomonoides_exilis_PA203 / gene_product=unspecified product / transcript_product=unspecified product / location=Mono_scaffold00776:13336-18452(-) / protein_length=1546 / sequence_SO=supercontig / SO=protein_coding / is_pseudo=false